MKIYIYFIIFLILILPSISMANSKIRGIEWGSSIEKVSKIESFRPGSKYLFHKSYKTHDILSYKIELYLPLKRIYKSYRDEFTLNYIFNCNNLISVQFVSSSFNGIELYVNYNFIKTVLEKRYGKSSNYNNFYYRKKFNNIIIEDIYDKNKVRIIFISKKYKHIWSKSIKKILKDIEKNNNLLKSSYQRNFLN